VLNFKNFDVGMLLN